MKQGGAVFVFGPDPDPDGYLLRVLKKTMLSPFPVPYLLHGSEYREWYTYGSATLLLTVVLLGIQ